MNWKIRSIIKLVIYIGLFIYFLSLSDFYHSGKHIRISSFISGFILFLVIFELVYFSVCCNFELEAKKNNLKVKQCIKCKNRFYVSDFDTTELCYNCIAIGKIVNENDEN